LEGDFRQWKLSYLTISTKVLTIKMVNVQDYFLLFYDPTNTS